MNVKLLQLPGTPATRLPPKRMGGMSAGQPMRAAPIAPERIARQ